MPNESPVPDKDLPLVQRAQAGELDAFDELVTKYQSAMTALLFRFAPGRADLEDMVQETFVRAWRGLAGWKPEKPFVHWLKRIAVRVGLEFCRRNRRTPLSHASRDERVLEQIADEKAGGGREAADEVQFILAQLPPNDRALLTLLHLEEMPLAEIAQHFGWSVVNTKVRAYRARRRLRAILSRHGYDNT
jgi:RNA polymerase sigma-70 factor (ECF subfamily)